MSPTLAQRHSGEEHVTAHSGNSNLSSDGRSSATADRKNGPFFVCSNSLNLIESLMDQFIDWAEHYQSLQEAASVGVTQQNRKLFFQLEGNYLRRASASPIMIFCLRGGL